MIIGCIVTAGTMFLLVIFPKVYIALFEALVPSEPTSDFAGWRVLGLIGVAIGALFIYFGLLAL